MSRDKQSVEPTILSREYAAPIELVYEAWTHADHLKNWQVPFDGFECAYILADIRAGGSSLHKMTAPNGFEMWLLTRYETLTPPREIVFRQYTANADGDVIPNPQIPNWPKELRTTIELEQKGDATLLRLIWQPIEPSPEEARAFEDTRQDHDKGWGGGLENLKRYLQQ